MIAIETKQQFYTKTPIDWEGKPSTPKSDNPQLRGLARNMTLALEGKTTLIGADTMRSPGQEGTQQTIFNEMQQIVLKQCDQLIDKQTGLPSKENMQKWQNVVYLAPRLFGAISDIRGINDETVLNAAQFCLAAALDRTLMDRALFNAGIGGNDDTRGTQRLPAYTLSMVKTIREINSVHTSWAIIRQREEQSGKGLKKHEREAVENEVRNPQSSIRKEVETIDEAFKARNNIPDYGPTAELFSGASAAAALNGIMDPEKVRELNARNLKVMRDFASKLDVRFDVRDSLEWPDAGQPAERTMDILGRVKIDVLANDLEAHEDATYVQELESRGQKRGGKRGRDQSLVYAGSHGPSFGDAHDLPPTQLFDNPRPTPSFVISDGSIREREFNAARLQNIRTASPEKLLTTLQERLALAEQSGNIGEIEQLQDAIGQTEAWIAMPLEERAKRLPLYGSVMRTNTVEHPPYYFMEPVTVPVVIPTTELSKDANIIAQQDVFESTTEVILDGKIVKRKKKGVLVTYTNNGQEHTTYVVLTQEGKERQPAKFYKTETIDASVDLDIPLVDDRLDSYAIARHMHSLSDAIVRAEAAVELTHQGDRTAIHLGISQMKEVYADYEALHNELHHSWYK